MKLSPFNPLDWIRKPKEIQARVEKTFDFDLMSYVLKEWPENQALIETLLPKGGATLIFGAPKSLKSWLGLSLAIEAASPKGLVLGKFQVVRPLRSVLVEAEDLPTEVQKRLRKLLSSEAGMGCDPHLIRIVPRCPINLADPTWRKNLEVAIEKHRADFVVLDVLRRLFRGQINSAQDTAEFLEVLDSIREKYGCGIILIHHSRKGAVEIQNGALGSINITAWADVLVQIKNKVTEGTRAICELEIESKIANSPDPSRLILNLDGPTPLTLEGLGDTRMLEAQQNLALYWNSRDLMTVLDVGHRQAQKIAKQWIDLGWVHKVGNGKGGLARYTFCDRKDGKNASPQSEQP